MSTNGHRKATQRRPQNIKKAAAIAKSKKSIASMPRRTLSALGRRSAPVAQRKRSGSSEPNEEGVIRGSQGAQYRRAIKDGVKRVSKNTAWAMIAKTTKS